VRRRRAAADPRRRRFLPAGPDGGEDLNRIPLRGGLRVRAADRVGPARRCDPFVTAAAACAARLPSSRGLDKLAAFRRRCAHRKVP